MSGSSSNVVSVADLNVEQLHRVKTQLEEEVQLLINSLKQLKAVQNRLTESKEALQQLETANDGQSVLVPLTTSMYVPGVISNKSKVLVDIGTGYYVEKAGDEAVNFFQRKIDYVTKNLEKMQQAMKDKDLMREKIIQVLISRTASS